MPGLVTIEGTITPSTYLARGKRRTVTRTEYVDKLIRGGYVKVIADEPARVAATRAGAEARGAVLAEARIAQIPAADEPRRVWAAFLDDHEVAYPASATRDDLVARWHARLEADGDSAEAVNALSPNAQEFIAEAKQLELPDAD